MQRLTAVMTGGGNETMRCLEPLANWIQLTHFCLGLLRDFKGFSIK